ncbi:MAG TPA: hypothetical protein VF384_14405 [Planctomycetota bacterium]
MAPVRSIPLADALTALAEFPPDDEPHEVWLMHPHPPPRGTAAAIARKWLRMTQRAGPGKPGQTGQAGQAARNLAGARREH